MSNSKKFRDIMNYFEYDDEDEISEKNMDKNDNNNIFENKINSVTYSNGENIYSKDNNRYNEDNEEEYNTSNENYYEEKEENENTNNENNENEIENNNNINNENNDDENNSNQNNFTENNSNNKYYSENNSSKNNFTENNSNNKDYLENNSINNNSSQNNSTKKNLNLSKKKFNTSKNNLSEKNENESNNNSDKGFKPLPPPKDYEIPDVTGSNELQLKSTEISINDLISNNNMRDNLQRESYENYDKENSNYKVESVPLKYFEKNNDNNNFDDDNNNIDDDNPNFLLEQEKRRQERIQKEKEEENKMKMLNDMNERKIKTEESLNNNEMSIKELIQNNNNKNFDNKNDIEENDSFNEKNKNLKEKEEILKELLQKKKEEKELLENVKQEENLTNNKNSFENNPFEIDNKTNIIYPQNESNSENIFNNSIQNSNDSSIKQSNYNKENNINNFVIQNKFSFSSHDSIMKNKFINDSLKNSNNINNNGNIYNNNNNIDIKNEINEIIKKKIKKNNIKKKNVPIEKILYEDAKKQTKKKKNIEANIEKNINLNASKNKMSKNSHLLAIQNLGKNIGNIINKYKEKEQISFIGIIKALTDLNIFKEILKNIKINSENEDITENEILEQIKTKYKLIKDNKIPSNLLQEIDFIDQLWILLNANGRNPKYINIDTLKIFLQIIFSPVETTVKEIVNLLKIFLQTALFFDSKPYEKINSRNNNYIEQNLLKTIITENYISYEERWSLQKIVKTFLLFKKNRIAYIKTGKLNKSAEKDLQKYNENITFQPKLEYNYLETQNWMNKLDKYEEHEKLKKFALEKRKKENEDIEFEECTFQPNIKKRNKDNSYFDNSMSIELNTKKIFERLYDDGLRQNENKKNEILKKKEENLQNLRQKCTFKPNINSLNLESLNKSFIINKQIPGFEKFVVRTRKGIIERARKNYIKTKIPTGENYEKIKKRKFKPLNITDLKNYKKNEIKNIIDKNKINITYEENDNESDGFDDYFTIDLKLPNGNVRKIKIYENDDPMEIAENFCKTYNIKDNIKEKLAMNIKLFKEKYLINKEYEDEEKEEEEEEKEEEEKEEEEKEEDYEEGEEQIE